MTHDTDKRVPAGLNPLKARETFPTYLLVVEYLQMSPRLNPLKARETFPT